jgi:transposase InsO family protein
MREQHPTWGARKIRARLQRIDSGQYWPASSTIHRLMAAAGLVGVPRKRRVVPYIQSLVPATEPNQVWCMDFKGSFECGNGERCDTFTVTDAFSRFVLHCQAINNLGHQEVDRICDELMNKYGVPERIRTDNGTPFSSISGLGISKLSIKWMRLGIVHERIEPGKPTQNGKHERMHRTLKEDTASPPAPTLAIQRERFTAFQHCFNEQRPHQALGMQTPAFLYRPSARLFPSSLNEIKYDERHIVRPVRNNRTIRWKSKEVFITEVLRRERVGLLPRSTDTFEIYFGELQLGLLDSQTATFRPNPGCLLRQSLDAC